MLAIIASSKSMQTFRRHDAFFWKQCPCCVAHVPTLLGPKPSLPPLQYLALQMEACLVAIPNSESLVDFAFYKPGQITLLLKDKSRMSHGGSTSCRLVMFALQDLPFMLLDRYSNGTNQLSQHVFEVSSCFTTLTRIKFTVTLDLSLLCGVCLPLLP